ncbi:MAG: hypothetical protein HYR84_02850 [Planctomycetes bacterium]|nr:hypothetical protein [Planctomycetota bacterium]
MSAASGFLGAFESAAKAGLDKDNLLRLFEALHTNIVQFDRESNQGLRTLIDNRGLDLTQIERCVEAEMSGFSALARCLYDSLNILGQSRKLTLEELRKIVGDVATSIQFMIDDFGVTMTVTRKNLFGKDRAFLEKLRGTQENVTNSLALFQSLKDIEGVSLVDPGAIVKLAEAMKVFVAIQSYEPADAPALMDAKSLGDASPTGGNSSQESPWWKFW